MAMQRRGEADTKQILAFLALFVLLAVMLLFIWLKMSKLYG